MAEALDMRGAALDAEEFALASIFVVARIDRGTLERDRVEHLHPADDLDLVSIRIGQAHPLAAARLVDVLDRRSARDPRDLIEILHACRMNGDPEIARLAQF